MSRNAEHRRRTREAFDRYSAITHHGQRNHQRWTRCELDFLKANYRRMPLAKLALQLGRRYSAVVAKVTILGLFKATRWTKEQEDFLWANADKGWNWCAKQLGKTASSVQHRASRKGITSRYRAPRNDAKRMATLRTNLLEKYGVETIRGAIRVRRQRHRMASLTIGLHQLASKLEAAERNRKCRRK